MDILMVFQGYRLYTIRDRGGPSGVQDNPRCRILQLPLYTKTAKKKRKTTAPAGRNWISIALARLFVN